MIIFVVMDEAVLTLQRQSKTTKIPKDMKKTFMILAIVAIMASISSGKVMRRQLNIFQSSVPETETLAPENMEFVYDYRCCVDTTGSLENNISGDNMLLQIGPDGLSKFSSYKNLTVDSLLMSLTDVQIM